jgi:hypothetical protein
MSGEYSVLRSSVKAPVVEGPRATRHELLAVAGPGMRGHVCVAIYVGYELIAAGMLIMAEGGNCNRSR